MKILLSPAKTFAKVLHPAKDTPYFQHEAINLMDSLKKVPQDKLKKDMKLSDALLLEVVSFFESFNHTKFEAISSYHGQVFKKLDYLSLSPKQKQDIQDQVLILSGLYGILKPHDGISFYRLEMQNQTLTNLYSFWEPKIKDYLIRHLKNEPLISLASEEYMKVISKDISVITIDFIERSHGKDVRSSMKVKTMRGLFLRYLIVNHITNINQMKAIKLEGYQYDFNRSTVDTLVYIKEV